MLIDDSTTANRENERKEMETLSFEHTKKKKEEEENIV